MISPSTEGTKLNISNILLQENLLFYSISSMPFNKFVVNTVQLGITKGFLTIFLNRASSVTP